METAIRFVKSRYFTMPSLGWILLIVLGLHITLGTALYPEYLPFERYGPLGQLAEYFHKNDLGTIAPFLICSFYVICHSVEAIYCWKLCSDKEIEKMTRFKWIISTLCFGGFSLYELVRYQPLVIQE